jgi:hypothetical protein
MTAAEFGSVFNVIPKNRAKVGICKEFDMWESGTKATNSDDMKLHAMNMALCTVTDDIREHIGLVDGGEYTPTQYLSIDELSSAIDEIDKKLKKYDIDDVAASLLKRTDRAKERLVIEHFKKCKSLKQTVFEIYSPESLSVSVEEFPIKRVNNKEVWMDGEVLFIDFDDTHAHEKLLEAIKLRFKKS